MVVRSSVAPDFPQLVLEVCRRALDVDVRGRTHIGMAEELLRRVDVAGREVELGPRRVASAVHLLAARRPFVDDAGTREAAVPPAMERRPGERLASVFPDHGSLRPALLRVEQVLERVAAERQVGELLAKLLGRDRRVPDLRRGARRPGLRSAFACKQTFRR
jgi:hypothetical protein